jgi:hypothetical protein
MASRPAVKPALVTPAQRVLCTILVAATFAACSPPAAARPVSRPINAAPPQTAVPVPDFARGRGGGATMGFYVSTCLSKHGPRCLNFVFAIGEITPRTPQDFGAFTQELHRVLPQGFADTDPWALIFDSPGGNVAAALALGRAIRAQGWDTVAGADYPLAGQTRMAKCASACVYAFAGGARRYVVRDDAIGVHQFTSPQMTVADAQYLTATLSAYLIDMGVSANLQALAGLTLAQNVTVLTERDALALGLATRN